MHILESFALNTGLRIDKPYLYEKFIPLPFQNDYITLQPYGKFPCRKYDYWVEVLEILHPVLKDYNIKVLQLGSKEERPVDACFDMRGKTDFAQAGYLIKNSLLHLGVDSFGVHFASGFNKKIVGLYSNMLPAESGPYWSDNKDAIMLEPPREKHERPSYAVEENPKTINKIKPEDIANAVCRLLKIELDYPYKTLHIGQDYHMNKIELVPVNFITNFKSMGVDSMIVRMDLYFNEQALQKQLGICKCSIVTNQPIDIRLLAAYQDRITEFVFFIDEKTDIQYFKDLKANGINFFLMSKLEGEDLDKIKLRYLETAPILPKKVNTKRMLKNELKGKDMKNIYYKSSSLSVLRNELYRSSPYLENNATVDSLKNLPPVRVIDHPDFWQDLSQFLILEKIA